MIGPPLNDEATTNRSKRPLLHAFLLVGGCLLTYYLYPFFVEGAIRKLDTPETAMDGMARVHAYNRNGIVFLLFAVAWLYVAFGYWRNPRLSRWSVLPVLVLLPLYHTCRMTAEEIDSTPAFQENCIASESDLLAFAQSVKAGAKPTLPARVGRFQITRTEVLGTGAVVLITHEEPNWNSRMWGFVWYPNQPFTEAGASAVGFNGKAGEENRVSRLHVDWYVLFSHYDFIKRGWS